MSASDVWSDQKPLYIWSEGKADLAPIKAAKLALGIEAKVIPIGVATLVDLPNLNARVLAVGTRPPFICEYALTTAGTSGAGWQRALSWVLGETEYDDKATTIEDIMVSMFGAGTREISAEELESERKMRAYVNRED